MVKCSNAPAPVSREAAIITQEEILLRLVLAVLLGGVIGYERERHVSTAGLRTHMLVCLGSALAIIVSAFGFEDVIDQPHVALDPSRIAAQVVSGVGFLGAGAILIMHRFEVVRGLTTAAGLWTVATIGLAAGSGLYFAAIGTTAIAFVILFLLKLVEQRLLASRRARVLRVESGRGRLQLAEIEALAAAHGLAVQRATFQQADGTDTAELWLMTATRSGELAPLVDALRAVDGVVTVELTAPA